MTKSPTHDDQPLNIPSFLASLRQEPLPDIPHQQTTLPLSEEDAAGPDEVDAMMDDVLQAAGVDPLPRTPTPKTRQQDEGILPEAEYEVLDDAPEQPDDTPAELEGATEDEETPADEPAERDQERASEQDEPESETQTELEPESEPPVPSLEEDLEHLRYVERHLYAHRYARTELETFGETIDPPKATADRAETLAVLMEEDHELLSKPEVGAMLDRLGKRGDELEPIVADQVRVLTRDRHQLVSVSAADQADLMRLTAEAYDVWLQAKSQDDWRSFAPYLDRIVALKRKIALAKNPDADPYDTLLDENEQGTNRAFYNAFFASVKRTVVPLLSSIAMSRRTLSRACVAGRFDESRQWELARDIAHLEGIDEQAHFLTSTEHPFSDAMTSNYAVTAGHVVADDLLSNIYSVLHEVGHSMYEQGVDPSLNRTSLKGGTSMGMHESQSRFFENYVGRDRAFIGPLLALMKQRFPGQLSRVTPNQLYQAVNCVAPTLIRTEADELTYPLHIVVRYEIEQLLMDGKATAAEVPALWAERYRSYIGAEVTNDAEGALQDVHWSQGLIGYFPTYALGNAYGAQLRAKMLSEGLDWNGCLASGDLSPIRAWLRDRVWRFGRSKDPAQIIEAACGEPFTPKYYAAYLTNKYSALYNLR